MIKTIFDFFTAIAVLIILAIPLLVVAFLVRMTSPGPIIHWSKRVGKNNKIFKMPKFRTMLISTPQLATHLLENPEQFLTPVGSFLRKTSLDELPQLWSVFSGEMSFVGPRPALFNQDDLVQLRTEKNIHTLKPGITGWAQINGRDEVSIPTKVSFDEEYLKKQSFYFDLKILFLTVYKVSRSENVKH